MWISKFRVENFSSFQDSDWIELDKSLNVFIGQNNSGKSAILKALNFPLAGNAHKNPTAFRGTELKSPHVSIDINVTPREIFHRFSILGETPIFPGKGPETQLAKDIVNRLSNLDDELTLELSRTPINPTKPRGGVSIAHFRGSNQQVNYVIQLINGSPSNQGRSTNAENLFKIIDDEKSDGFFYFDAQRLNLGSAPWMADTRLKSNASNLATVLAHLQGARRPIFDLIESHVIAIIGGIDRITVVPRDGGHEILIWPDRTSQYEDLSFSLNESGTGVGQILAIITAMVTAEQSVFLIDEINTFLHPAAVKRLMSLIKSEYNHHQYIISTHSSDVITSATSDKIYLVRREGFHSSVRAISMQDAAHAREVSAALGFSMMDVFGHDRMIWVEGPTEEICLPYIARRLGIDLDGIGFAPVISTSDFGQGSQRSATDVYEQAGKRLSPLLLGMAFGLDRERLSDEEVAKLEKGRRKLRFLPRRCLECYLIQPEAIALTLSELDQQEHSSAAVEAALQIGGMQKYGAPNEWNGDYRDRDWLKRVDGARLLKDLFNNITDSRVEYRKTRDGISILTKSFGTTPDLFDELSEFVERLVEIARRDTAP
ncbi:AAA family ATPase [Sphingomonas sp.]|uniref:ATP-dependent nuclease n=1 Tax=Sphingomonas sp. TaxID=28214 RepID=UPI0025FB37E0|nr:AAA family ATPase [Sphingomonas sp.]